MIWFPVAAIVLGLLVLAFPRRVSRLLFAYQHWQNKLWLGERRAKAWFGDPASPDAQMFILLLTIAVAAGFVLIGLLGLYDALTDGT